jgi:hypothetical protein
MGTLSLLFLSAMTANYMNELEDIVLNRVSENVPKQLLFPSILATLSYF